MAINSGDLIEGAVLFGKLSDNEQGNVIEGAVMFGRLSDNEQWGFDRGSSNVS